MRGDISYRKDMQTSFDNMEIRKNTGAITCSIYKLEDEPLCENYR